LSVRPANKLPLASLVLLRLELIALLALLCAQFIELSRRNTARLGAQFLVLLLTQTLALRTQFASTRGRILRRLGARFRPLRLTGALILRALLLLLARPILCALRGRRGRCRPLSGRAGRWSSAALGA
jgi:hypothetical protein